MYLVFPLHRLEEETAGQQEPPDLAVLQTGGEELGLGEDPGPLQVEPLEHIPGGVLAGGGGTDQGEDISDHLEPLPGIQHSVTVNVVQAERPLE